MNTKVWHKFNDNLINDQKRNSEITLFEKVKGYVNWFMVQIQC